MQKIPLWIVKLDKKEMRKGKIIQDNSEAREKAWIPELLCYKYRSGG